MRVEWRDLSDSELRAKLEQRGIHPAIAAAAVRDRENARVAANIDRELRP